MWKDSKEDEIIYKKLNDLQYGRAIIFNCITSKRKIYDTYENLYRKCHNSFDYAFAATPTHTCRADCPAVMVLPKALVFICNKAQFEEVTEKAGVDISNYSFCSNNDAIKELYEEGEFDCNIIPKKVVEEPKKKGILGKLFKK